MVRRVRSPGAKALHHTRGPGSYCSKTRNALGGACVTEASSPAKTTPGGQRCPEKLIVVKMPSRQSRSVGAKRIGQSLRKNRPYLEMGLNDGLSLNARKKWAARAQRKVLNPGMGERSARSPCIVLVADVVT